MAIAYLETVTATGNNVTSVTTPSMNTVSGNGIVAQISIEHSSGGAYSSFTDSVSHPWTASYTGAGSASTIRERYNSNITGNAAHTFTVTLTEPGYPTLAVSEISGQDNTGALHVAATGDATSGTTHNTTNITTTIADCLLFGVAGSSGFDGAHTFTNADVNFITRSNTPYASGQTGLLVATRVTTETGTYNEAYQTSDTAAPKQATSAYKAAAVPGGHPTIRRLGGFYPRTSGSQRVF